MKLRELGIVRKLGETPWIIPKRRHGYAPDVGRIRLIVTDPDEESITRTPRKSVRLLLEILLQD